MTNTQRVMALLMISGTCWRPYWILKKPMDGILHTLPKLFSYAYINSYQSLKNLYSISTLSEK